MDSSGNIFSSFGFGYRQPRAVSYAVRFPKSADPETFFGTEYGARVMDSTPPATMISASPVMIAREAWMMASSDDPQSRLIVVAGTRSGSPASSAPMRPTFRLSSPA